MASFAASVSSSELASPSAAVSSAPVSSTSAVQLPLSDLPMGWQQRHTLKTNRTRTVSWPGFPAASKSVLKPLPAHHRYRHSGLSAPLLLPLNVRNTFRLMGILSVVSSLMALPWHSYGHTNYKQGFGRGTE
ncbi:hypothetical protein BX616_005341, partial [Lobosporangium transversale]